MADQHPDDQCEERKVADEGTFCDIAGRAAYLALDRLIAAAENKEDIRELDRGARSARAFIAVAKDADQLRQQHEKERLAHEHTAEEEFTVDDDRIRDKRKEIAGRLTRIENEDRLRREGGRPVGGMGRGERA